MHQSILVNRAHLPCLLDRLCILVNIFRRQHLHKLINLQIRLAFLNRLIRLVHRLLKRFQISFRRCRVCLALVYWQMKQRIDTCIALVAAHLASAAIIDICITVIETAGIYAHIDTPVRKHLNIVHVQNPVLDSIVDKLRITAIHTHHAIYIRV